MLVSGFVFIFCLGCIFCSSVSSFFLDFQTLWWLSVACFTNLFDWYVHMNHLMVLEAGMRPRVEEEEFCGIQRISGQV